MSGRRDDGERWLLDFLLLLAATILGAVLWLASGLGRRTAASYARHGHQAGLVAAGIGAGFAAVTTIGLTLVGWYAGAILLGLSTLAVWTASVAVLASVYDRQDRRASQALDEQAISDVLSDGPWWAP